MCEVAGALVWDSAGVSADRAAAPSGVVTFLFTDFEGSTRRWEADADGMRSVLAAHDAVLRSAIDSLGQIAGVARTSPAEVVQDR